MLAGVAGCWIIFHHYSRRKEIQKDVGCIDIDETETKTGDVPEARGGGDPSDS